MIDKLNVKQSDKRYRIHWRSDLTGAEGCGTGLFTQEEAEEYAKRMNNVPGRICTHWAEEVR